MQSMPDHRSSRSRHLTIRGLRYHVREWGPQQASPERTVWMLHGWMDVSASFQFVVDALAADWRVLAPDWRGYGLTDWSGADCYWFPDYLADLEALLDALTPGATATLLGHSMGGNVALLYAGIRPQRVHAVVNLEGFGLRGAQPDEAPRRYASWFDQLRTGAGLRDYASLAEVAARLTRNNPRLSAERASFLAAHWAEPDAEGRYRVAGDPAHRIVNPILYRLDEVLACFRHIECPVLWVQAEQTDVVLHLGPDRDEAMREIARRRAEIPRVETTIVREAGHMLHHDQPEVVAQMVADFVSRCR
jgi:pimeloyl-ACP methyl ester carboxylesterase